MPDHIQPYKKKKHVDKKRRFRRRGVSPLLRFNKGALVTDADFIAAGGQIVTILDEPPFLLKVYSKDGGGSIASEGLHEPTANADEEEYEDEEERKAYNNAIDGLESLVMAFAIASPAMASSPEFKEAVRTAIEGIANNC